MLCLVIARLGSVFARVSLAKSAPEVSILPTSAPPVIDGALDDPCRRETAMVSRLIDTCTETEAEARDLLRMTERWSVGRGWEQHQAAPLEDRLPYSVDTEVHPR